MDANFNPITSSYRGSCFYQVANNPCQKAKKLATTDNSNHKNNRQLQAAQ